MLSQRHQFGLLPIFLLVPLLLELAGIADTLRAADHSGRLTTKSADREVWSIQFDTFYHGTLDVKLLRDGQRITAGFAFGTVRNAPLLLDTSRLKVEGDHLSGPLMLNLAPLVFTAATKPDDSKLPQQEEVLLDVQQDRGRLCGMIASSLPVAMGLVDFHGLNGKPNSLPVWGKTQPHLPADNARVELMLLGIGSPGPNLVSAHGWGLALRMQLRDREIVEAIAIPMMEGTFADPPVPHPLPAKIELVSGHRLQGRIPVRYTSPKPENPKLDGIAVLDGLILGDHAAGTLTWVADGKSVASSFRATVSRAAAQVPLDLTQRTWAPQGKSLPADAMLAERALAESLVPLRPGEPGKRPFYNTRLVHCSGREGSVPALYAPAIEFAEVASAERYRITLSPARNSGLSGLWSFEQKQPWLPLTAKWKELPAGKLVVSATALDAEGKELGKSVVSAAKFDYVGGSPLDTEHWKLRANGVAKNGVQFPARETVTIDRRAPFNGPYFAHDRSPVESVLAAARWNAWTYGAARYRGLYGWGGFTAGDGGDNTTIASVARAFSLIARLSPDEQERREALAHAERIAWRMFLTHRDKKPTVYKGNAANVLWMALSYLDVYAASQDPRMKEAALNLAAVMAKEQQADGGWSNDQGWPGGTFGPSEFRTNGGEPMLLLFGRVRKELGTAEYLPVEERACEWVRQQCLPAMMWQNVGYHSGEMVLVQDSTAPHALAFCIWMLDYAPAKQRDLKLVEEIARWCEERHVDWSRDVHPKLPLTQPNCWGWSRAAGTGVQIAGRLAYVAARLGQETANPLWNAKSEAMIQALLATQDPILGGYAYHFHRTTDDGTGNLYDSVEVCDCVRKCVNIKP